MSENAITRRSFLTGSAGVVALAAGAGYISFATWETAYASDTDELREARVAHSLCSACPAQCGFTAYTIDGKLSKLIGDQSHPSSKGKLCARGYAYPQGAFSKDRLTNPLRKNENNEFETVSWEEAYSEIAEKVNRIIEAEGPQTLAAVTDADTSGAFYTKRFINALGSPNFCTHSALRDISQRGALLQTIGVEKYRSDVGHSKMVLIIGLNKAESHTPAVIASLKQAHDNNSYLVLVDSQYKNSQALIDEWVPALPGTELALLLAMAHVIVSENLYDVDFIAEHTVGFEQWREILAEYTPAWAEAKTGISAIDISRLSRRLASAAPAASVAIDLGNAASCAYANSGETARAASLLNTLLGSWNQRGGAIVTGEFPYEELGTNIAEPIELTSTPIGTEEYPLAPEVLLTQIVEGAHEGKIKGLVLCESNMVLECPDATYLEEAFANLDLCIAIDTELTDTAALADYVLPEDSYLEQLGLPQFTAGITPTVSLRNSVVSRLHTDTKSVDQIISELAEACGAGDYFKFSLEELADAQLKDINLSLSEMKRLGSTEIAEHSFEFGVLPEWATPSGKIQFSSEALLALGVLAPRWIEPGREAAGNKLRLVSGDEPVHFAAKTANVEGLMQITHDYDLTCAVINVQTARALGIKDGDEVELEGEGRSARCRVKTSEGINPTALYLPPHYGASLGQQRIANGIGVRNTDFIPFQFEPGYGSPMIQEALVSIKKVGA